MSATKGQAVGCIARKELAPSPREHFIAGVMRAYEEGEIEG